MKLANATLLLLAFVGLLACQEDEVVYGHGGAADASASGAKPAPEDAKGTASKAPPKTDFDEAEFAESEKSRDPFRSFDKQFAEERQGHVESQRKVVLDQYTIDQLKLIGIVTRVHPARAMMVDPTGIGHVITRGQFIGKAEVVQTAKGVGASYEVNWRVDRIRPGDVVLVREDPTNPDVPSATRVVTLHNDKEQEMLEQIENPGS